MKVFYLFITVQSRRGERKKPLTAAPFQKKKVQQKDFAGMENLVRNAESGSNHQIVGIHVRVCPHEGVQTDSMALGN